MATYPLNAVRGLEKTTQRFREQLVAGAFAHGLDPSLLAAVISYESGFDPKADNPRSSALGLIQWIDDFFPPVAKKAGMNVTHADIPKLSAEEQLPLVFAWFDLKPAVARLGTRATATDYYLTVFSPAFIGYPKDYELGRRDSTEMLRLKDGRSVGQTKGEYYAANPGFDTTGKGYFTVGDLGRKIEGVVASGRGRPPIPVPLAPTTPAPRGAASVSSTLPSASSSQAAPTSSSKTLSGRPGPRRQPVGLPTLVQGDHGPAVYLLQMLLDLSAPDDQGDLAIDGDFGPATELWLALHQTERKITPSGNCDAETWKTFWADETWALDRYRQHAERSDSEFPLPLLNRKSP